jgi:hypothetical protein
MKKTLLLSIIAFAFAGTAFSKGHPASIAVSYNGNNVLSLSVGIYYVNGQLTSYPAPTYVLEMNEGDSCLVLGSISYDDHMTYEGIFRNDSALLVRTTGGFLDCWIKKEGSYMVKVNTANYMGTELHFAVKFKSGTVQGLIPAAVPVLGFVIYPNPTAGDFSLRTGDEEIKGSARVTDLNGKLVWAEPLSLASNTQYTIPASQWQQGVYFLELFANKGVQRFKIVKN